MTATTKADALSLIHACRDNLGDDTLRLLLGDALEELGCAEEVVGWVRRPEEWAGRSICYSGRRYWFDRGRNQSKYSMWGDELPTPLFACLQDGKPIVLGGVRNYPVACRQYRSKKDALADLFHALERLVSTL